MQGVFEYLFINFFIKIHSFAYCIFKMYNYSFLCIMTNLSRFLKHFRTFYTVKSPFIHKKCIFTQLYFHNKAKNSFSKK